MSLVNKILKRAHGRRPVSCAPSVPSMSRGVKRRHADVSDPSASLCAHAEIGASLRQGHTVTIPLSCFPKSGTKRGCHAFQNNAKFLNRCKPSKVRAASVKGVNLDVAVLSACARKRTQGSESSRQSRVLTYTDLVDVAFPVTIESLRTFVARTQVEHYRSIPNYLRDIRKEHKAKEFTWTQSLEVELQDLIVSSGRFQGDRKKAAVYEPDKILECCSLEEPPVHSEGPIFPAWSLALCASWCLRGIETLALMRSQASWSAHSKSACISFLEQKNDTSGAIEDIELGCAMPLQTTPCPAETFCPSCIMGRFLAARDCFYSKLLLDSSEDPRESSLFCTSQGMSVSAEGLAATISALVHQTGSRTVDPLGRRIHTQHSPRHSGLMILSRARLGKPTICAISRHSAGAVDSYLREASRLETTEAAALIYARRQQFVTPSALDENIFSSAIDSPNLASVDLSPLFDVPELDPDSFDGIAFLKFDSPRFPSKFHVLVAPGRSRCAFTSQARDSPWVQELAELPLECAGQDKSWACKRCFHGYLAY